MARNGVSSFPSFQFVLLHVALIASMKDRSHAIELSHKNVLRLITPIFNETAIPLLWC